jgi:methionine-rich copper-binding protein CopC
MIARRTFFGGLALAAAANPARADSLKVLETAPASGAVLKDASSEYFVRFDQPVDHIRSRFLIKQNGAVVHTLAPRFKTAPEVLFARAPTLPAGSYAFHWSVRSLTGTEVLEGEVPFSVAR